MAKPISEQFNDLSSVAQIGVFAVLAALVGGGLFYYFVIPLMKRTAEVTAQLVVLRLENEEGRYKYSDPLPSLC